MCSRKYVICVHLISGPCSVNCQRVSSGKAPSLTALFGEQRCGLETVTALRSCAGHCPCSALCPTHYYHLHCTLHGCVCSARKTSELWTKWTKWSVCNWILFQLSCWMYLAPLKLINRGTSVTLIIASIIRMLLLSKVLLCCLSCRWYHLFPENVSFISSAPSGISATWFQLSSNNGWVWEGLRPCAYHAQYLSPLAFSWIGAFSTSSFEPCATLFSQINYFLVWCQ